jgi:sugar/nucleoside kinase (ribokinase family)
MTLRDQVTETKAHARPLFIWEPVPDLCTPNELTNCLEALKVIDVISPNHSELGGFFGADTNETDHVNFRSIEGLCDQWLQSGIGLKGEGGIVVRAGKDGCLVARRGSRKWLSAYHQSAEKVIDPTGGGNGFLGGLAMGLVRGETSSGVSDLEEAAIWGSISASFAIEQIGMPVLSSTDNGETWNGARVEERKSEFKERLHRYVQP